MEQAALDEMLESIVSDDEEPDKGDERGDERSDSDEGFELV
jgi:hypothetical protein